MIVPKDYRSVDRTYVAERATWFAGELGLYIMSPAQISFAPNEVIIDPEQALIEYKLHSSDKGWYNESYIRDRRGLSIGRDFNYLPARPLDSEERRLVYNLTHPDKNKVAQWLELAIWQPGYSVIDGIGRIVADAFTQRVFTEKRNTPEASALSLLAGCLEAAFDRRYLLKDAYHEDLESSVESKVILEQRDAWQLDIDILESLVNGPVSKQAEMIHKWFGNKFITPGTFKIARDLFAIIYESGHNMQGSALALALTQEGNLREACMNLGQLLADEQKPILNVLEKFQPPQMDFYRKVFGSQKAKIIR